MPIPRPPPRLIALGLLIAASGATCLVALLNGWLRPAAVRAMVADAGSWALLAYVGAVVAMELIWLPRMWGLLAGGLLFGPWIGGALSLGADMAAALICYGLARGAGRAWVAEQLQRRPRARKISEMLAQRRGTVTIVVLRVCPIAHYTLVSYAAGLAGVRPGAFTVGNLVGILPGAVLYPIVGDALLHPGSPAFIVSLAVLAVFLVATVVAGRRALRC